MKLPDIVQQPVGEYALGNIPVPRYDELGKALGRAVSGAAETGAAIVNNMQGAQVDEATGAASTELGELRAKLVNNNTVDADWVGDDALGQLQVSPASRTANGEREVDTPVTMFTHEVASQIWDKRSQEIVAHYSETISNPKARSKFIGEMTQRYIAPGTQAVLSANIIRGRAYGQAQAERAVENTLASIAPTSVREAQSREIIERQLVLGADPTWAEIQLSNLGPDIDQIDVQNAIINTQSLDQLDLIEEELWEGSNRMSPETRRTVSSQLDQRRADFNKEDAARQDNNADELFGQFIRGELTNAMLDRATTDNSITRQAGMQLYNMLNKGGTTSVSNPAVVSRWELEIARLPYTGGTQLVSAKANQLERVILGLATSTDAHGMPTGIPPTISGSDAFDLIAKARAAKDKIKDNDPYRESVRQVKAYTGVKDEFGTLFGNQPNVDAYVAFKNSLDAYMDQFGNEADPVAYVQKNRAIYHSENFEDPVNNEFVEQVPWAKAYMTEEPGKPLTFSDEQRTAFKAELSARAADGRITRDQANAAAAYYFAFYEGRGYPPNAGAPLLPQDSEFYGQFR